MTRGLTVPLLPAVIAAGLFAASCGEVRAPDEESGTPPYPSQVAHLVNPFVGTAGEGNTFPGAVAPWGLAAPSPHNVYTTAADYLQHRPLVPSGYSYGRTQLFDFGLTHLSGVGCPDLGAPVIAVSLGDVKPQREARADRYSDEVAWPGYYRVKLLGSGIRVEATATPRVALLRIRYPERLSADANLLIDVGQNLSWGGGEGSVRVLSGTEVEGSSQTGLFCARMNRQTIFFVARLSQSAEESGTFVDDKSSSTPSASGRAGAYLRFRPASKQPLEIKVGLSLVSTANARQNLDAEAGSLSFEGARAQSFAAWDQALSRLQVAGGSEEQRRMVYTALYHALIHPSVVSDSNGEHPRMRPASQTPGGPGQIERAVGYQRHHVFSLWDTYRGVHPLLTLLYPQRQRDLLRSLEEMTHESGVPPLWELGGNEVNMMIGDPVMLVFADAQWKGLAVKDPAALFERLRAAANKSDETPPRRPGNASYRSLGYVPMEEAADVWGPVSTTLEYAYADWALSRLAGALHRDDDATFFLEESHKWRKLQDPQTGLFRPRDRQGQWLTPFNPDALEGSRGYVRSGGPGFVEGTAWNWAFAVPHDIEGLAEARGGVASLIQQLQRHFDEGKFVMWNEPDIAFPYLFALLGAGWRTDREVHRTIEKYFKLAPDGLPGNDDAGTLSAWLVFSAIGLYPDCPGLPRYTLTAPLFDRVELQLDPSLYRGQRFVIEAQHASTADIFIKERTLGGTPLELPELSHEQVGAGGTLRLRLSATAPGN